VAIVVADRLSPDGWWHHWILYVFPASFIVGAASGIVDGFYYELIALSIAANVLLYAVAGLLIGIAWRSLSGTSD